MKLFLFMTLLCIMIFSTTCKKIWFSGLVYSGNVTDLHGNPVQGVLVTLNACGGGRADEWQLACWGHQIEIGNSTTDASGHFSIHGRKSRINSYFVIVSHNNVNYGINPDGLNENQLSSNLQIP